MPDTYQPRTRCQFSKWRGALPACDCIRRLAKLSVLGDKQAMSMPMDMSPQDAVLAALELARRLCRVPAAVLAAEAAAAKPLGAAAADRLALMAPLIADIIDAPDGFETALDIIAAAVPPAQIATAYALTADFIAAHGSATPEEMRYLEKLGDSLRLNRLTRAALDTAARARAGDLA